MRSDAFGGRGGDARLCCRRRHGRRHVGIDALRQPYGSGRCAEWCGRHRRPRRRRDGVCADHAARTERRFDLYGGGRRAPRAEAAHHLCQKHKWQCDHLRFAGLRRGVLARGGLRQLQQHHLHREVHGDEGGDRLGLLVLRRRLYHRCGQGRCQRGLHHRTALCHHGEKRHL